MIRLLVWLLAMFVAMPSAAAGEPDLPPGRATELSPCESTVDRPRDCKVPYQGTLLDKERMGHILAKRDAAEAETALLRVQVATVESRAVVAEARASSSPSWGALIAVGAVATVVGLVGGIALVFAVR